MTAGGGGAQSTRRAGRQVAPAGTPRPVGVKALATGRVASEDL